MRNSFILLCIIYTLTSFTTEKELSWVAIGDSITYLDGHPEESDNRITKGYMTRVVERLPYIHFKSHGHNGWTTSRMAGAIETLGIEKADIYSVFLGTNDWWGSFPIGDLSDYQNNTGNKTMYGAFRTIISKILTLNPEAKIILITPMQRGDFVHIKNFKNNAHGSYKDKNGHMLSEYTNAINTLAGLEKFEVIDLYYKSKITPKNCVKYKLLKDPQTGAYKNYSYPTYTTIPFNPLTDNYPYPLNAINMTYDGLHPSDKGLEIIARMLVKVMKKY